MISIVKVYDKQVPSTHREYCGRPGKGQEGLLGNPFAANADHSNRDEVCDKFEEYFKDSMTTSNKLHTRINELVEIAKTQDIELACFCQSPKDVIKKRCHTMTIKAYIEQQLEESKMKEFELIGNLGIDKANTLLNQVSNEQFTRTNAYFAKYYGTCSYKYTGANHPAKEMPKYLSDLASELEVKENLPNGYFNMVLINRYPSNKGLGRHRDNEPEITALSSIASISLGASRVFSITKGYNNLYLELELTHGDIVMMRGRSQIDYYHAVIPSEGIRFNLTFRHNANAPKREESKMKTKVNEPIGIIRPVVNQMDCVPSFRNELAFLSNMYECKVESNYYGCTFQNAEAAYQAMKCTVAVYEFINVDGYTAKRLGKQVELRSDWNEVKLSIMEKILRAKFQGELLQKLLAVKGEIVERNNWGDFYWGICNGKGENHLGKLLMKIRDEAEEDIHILNQAREIELSTY